MLLRSTTIFFTCLLLKTDIHNVLGSILKSVSLTDKCIVNINGKEIVKDVGTKWITNDSCIWHSCEVNELAETYEILTEEKCSTECKDGFELKHKLGKCCGECVEMKCSYENITYKIGETWSSNDNCTTFKCEDSNGNITISSSNTTCPEIENCSPNDLYEKDCCKLCRRTEATTITTTTTEAATQPTTVINDVIKEKIILNASPVPLQEHFDENEGIDDAIYSPSFYENHPCKRDCIENEAPMICEYVFVIEWYETLSKACYDCPTNLTDCYRPHCIYGDGVRRSVTVINRMMPGPSIEVCQHDTIIVDVKNRLLGESTTMHWHGIHQKETPYMDGVPHISQCPIQPHTTFRYTFPATNSGTHFWHSHTGMQRGDGAFGALIVKKPANVDPHRKLYDFDLSEHKIIVQDWAHVTGVAMFASHHHSIGSNKPPNVLVNGKGRYHPAEEETRKIVNDNVIKLNLLNLNPVSNGDIPYVIENNKETQNDYPLEVFNVVKDKRYRFRIINAEFLNCPIAISIDNHTISVISSDGFDLEPVDVGSVVTYAGERFDFILETNQTISNYWIRFKGLMDCDERFTKAFQVAVLHYEGATIEEPSETPVYEYMPEGIVLNALNVGPGQINSLTISELHSLNQIEDEEEILMAKPDYKFYVYYDFYPKDNPNFHRKNIYGFNQIRNTIDNKLFTPQLNHISLKMPSLPMLPARDIIDESTFCNASSLTARGIDCTKEFCECSHVLQVSLNAIVEFVIIDEGVTYDANHPFHLHGNAFYVTGMDRVAKNVTFKQIQDLDDKGLLKRKRSRAPIKDTITVPDGGYTIIRFKADNPGYWLFHCHIEFHAEIGMAFVLKVGTNDQMKPVPKNFPTCFDYTPNYKSNIIEKNYANAIKLHLLLFISVIILAIIKIFN